MREPKSVKRFFLTAILIISSLEITLRIGGYLYLNRLYIELFKNLKPCTDNINIVCLGESSTAGLWVDFEDSYPRQLERKLRNRYSNKNINVIVPPHVGQNTSQVFNRIRQYIDLYKPKLIVLMVGVNNEWSLAESHIGKFLNCNTKEALRIKALTMFENLRLFRALRYVFLRFIVFERSEYVDRNKLYALGHPELVRVPAEPWVYSFAAKNKDAFMKLWRYDLKNIIAEAKKNKIPVMLLTYHINPTYLPIEEFIAIAEEFTLPLVRNDKTFEKLREQGILMKYLLADNWHPNKDGYALISENVFDCIKNNDVLGINKSENRNSQ